MNNHDLKDFACACGADHVGIADLARLQGIQTCPEDLMTGYTRGVSIAIRLADGVIDQIVDAPTPLYQQHYSKVNALLDDIAVRVSQFLQEAGARALPIPASQVLDTTEWFSYLSHKAVAVAAGVGWQGKSLLVIHPKCGPRIRLVTVLTDLSLKPDKPIRNRCGKCMECTDACPAQAIKNVNTDLHYADRSEALHFDRCVAKLTEDFAKRPLIGNRICGVCIKVCPMGRRKRRRMDYARPLRP